jgi:hypothetical protein
MLSYIRLSQGYLTLFTAYSCHGLLSSLHLSRLVKGKVTTTLINVCITVVVNGCSQRCVTVVAT